MSVFSGLNVIEIAGLAPAPFCGLILSDFGANVIRVDKKNSTFNPDQLTRGKKSISLDLKSDDGKNVFIKLIEQADILIEPFRPGVMEKLGLSPTYLHKINPRLIYTRITGFGQYGDYSTMAGHDINYISLSGALSLFGRSGEKPIFPMNILGDFAGGGMLGALGICFALIERSKSNLGQTVDAAMLDGTSYLVSMISRLQNSGAMPTNQRGQNLLDSGAPFYEVYETQDGKYMSVGAIEPQFYDEFLKGLDITPKQGKKLGRQNDQDNWPKMKEKFTKIFLTKTRDEWTKIFEGKDACVTPVLELDEVSNFKHNQQRDIILEDGAPNSAPKLSRTPSVVKPQKNHFLEPNSNCTEILKHFGFSNQEIENLKNSGTIVELDNKKPKL